LIELKNVYKIYKSKAGAVTALKGISLKIGKGEFVCIMGPSGSGKTTMLNLIGGIDAPSAGEVIVAGRSLSSLSERELEDFRLRTIGYVFQEYNLIPGLTALENVMLPMILAGESEEKAKKRARDLLAEVGLEGKENKLPDELSGGEKQRVSIGIALANDPPIIIADEPTGELDIESGEKVMEIFKRAHVQGRTVLITTHDPRVARMTERIILLEDGRIKGEYSPKKVVGGKVEEEISAEESVRRFLESRIRELDREIEAELRKLKEGKIGVEEFISAYNKLKSLKEAYVQELNRLGISR